MNTLEAIFTRRSVRDFTNQPVDAETVKTLLRAAMSAPSAGNQQPWHFVVIEDKTILEGVTKFHPYSAMLPHTPLAILVCGDTSRERHKGYWVQDCSAATQNILLAARDLGLGAVWLGFYPVQDRVDGMKALLGIDDDAVIPMALIAIGHTEVKQMPVDRYDESRVRRNKWK